MTAVSNSSGRPTLAPHQRGLLLVAFSAVLWSTAGYFTRAVPIEFASLLFWRGLFGAATSFLFVLASEGRRTWRAFLGIGRVGLAFCLLSGCGMACFVASLTLTSVAHVSIIYACVPFVAAALAWLTMRERTSWALLGASSAALVGVGVTVAGSAGEGSLAGDALALAMTVIVAAFTVLRRRFPDVPLAPAASISALLPALAVLPFLSGWPAGGREFTLLAAFGITNMGLALLCFTVGAKLIPAGQTALVSALETPLAPLWVWLAFDETPRPATLIGGGIVLVAVFANVVWESRAVRPAG